MADKTAIEWTDATWNPVVGCSIVSPGCTNCYAMKQAYALEKRFGSQKYSGLTKVVNGHPVWRGEVRVHWEAIDQPLNWKRPRRIFVNSMSDLFHKGVAFDDIAQIFGVMIAAHQLRGHVFQVLTKRPRGMRDTLRSPVFWDRAVIAACAKILGRVPFEPIVASSFNAIKEYALDNPPAGIWLGVSAEDQDTANDRIPALLETPASVLFLSYEPALGPLDLTYLRQPDGSWIDALRGHIDATDELRAQKQIGWATHARLDWVIAGGESGIDARPAAQSWFERVRDDCHYTNVPFFFKQWGEWLPEDDAYDRELKCIEAGPPTGGMYRVGKRVAGRLLDGVTHDGFPS